MTHDPCDPSHSGPVTHMTHDPRPMSIASFYRTHGTKRGRGMVVLDNLLDLENQKSWIKIKPPAVIIGLIE